MTDSYGTGNVSEEAQRRIDRLERRLAREREARRQAEVISENGMRDLWLANRELDKRVAERTQTLAHALERLKVATSARDRFLATLSHEIRTPLNGVLGMLELLDSHVAGEQGRAYVEAATASADRLHVLIARLLDLVELDSGKFTVNEQPVSVADLAAVIESTWRRPALQSGQLLSVSASGGVVEIDEHRVIQIVDELIENAIRHADPGALRVRIDGDGVDMCIEIADSGPGIAPERIPELLEGDLTLGDDTTIRATQGLGVGLGICRRIAEALGGSLDISTDGDGSTARLRVPTAGAHAAAA